MLSAAFAMRRSLSRTELMANFEMMITRRTERSTRSKDTPDERRYSLRISAMSLDSRIENEGELKLRIVHMRPSETRVPSLQGCEGYRGSADELENTTSPFDTTVR